MKNKYIKINTDYLMYEEVIQRLLCYKLLYARPLKGRLEELKCTNSSKYYRVVLIDSIDVSIVVNEYFINPHENYFTDDFEFYLLDCEDSNWIYSRELGEFIFPNGYVEINPVITYKITDDNYNPKHKKNIFAI